MTLGGVVVPPALHDIDEVVEVVVQVGKSFINLHFETRVSPLIGSSSRALEKVRGTCNFE